MASVLTLDVRIGSVQSLFHLRFHENHYVDYVVLKPNYQIVKKENH